ncbi:Eukaryotic translation initiation factor 2B (eIF-2B) family protein, partial [Thalictrum thalictroides]
MGHNFHFFDGWRRSCYVTRTSALEYEDFSAAKSCFIECVEKFGEISRKARRTIAMLSQDFIFDG